jgi:hypothetical protein
VFSHLFKALSVPLANWEPLNLERGIFFVCVYIMPDPEPLLFNCAAKVDQNGADFEEEEVIEVRSLSRYNLISLSHLKSLTLYWSQAKINFAI